MEIQQKFNRNSLKNSSLRSILQLCCIIVMLTIRAIHFIQILQRISNNHFKVIIVVLDFDTLRIIYLFRDSWLLLGWLLLYVTNNKKFQIKSSQISKGSAKHLFTWSRFSVLTRPILSRSAIVLLYVSNWQTLTTL